MPLSFPSYGLSQIDVVPQVGMAWSRSEGGIIITSRRVDPFLKGRVVTRLLEPEFEHPDVLGFILRAVDENQRVDIIPPRHTVPIGYTDTSWPLVGNPTTIASITNLRTINIAGLFIGAVLPRGTRVTFSTGGGIYAHRLIAAPVTVTSTTNQAITITPRLPVGLYAAGNAVLFRNPIMRVMIVPDSYDVSEAVEETPISFDVIESFAF